MKKFIICTIFILAICGFASAQMSPRAALDKVKEIRLLEADRANVKEILSDFKLDDTDEEELYQEFSNETADIEIWYSSGNCGLDSTEIEEEDEDDEDAVKKWNVAQWKVTRIEITFDDEVKAEDIGYDLANYKKEQIYENRPDEFIYHDKNAGIAFETDEDEIEKIILYPSGSNSAMLCDNNKKERKFYSVESWFGDSKLENRVIYNESPMASVTDLTLSQTEVLADCSNAKNKSPSNGVKKIEVSTLALDSENDVLTYVYKVSGGKIVGEGANVVWDLTGVKPGDYIITAGVDDGCGVCGTTQT